MIRLLILAGDAKPMKELGSRLTRSGFSCSVVGNIGEDLAEIIRTQSPDLVLIETDSQQDDSELANMTQKINHAKTIPIIAMVNKDSLDRIDVHAAIKDFLVYPYDIRELAVRIKRLLHSTRNVKNSDLIICDGLAIDLVEREVTLEGKAVDLTFKEYELLKLMAGHRGRVYTREALLRKVWGYDYYGGDRTIDVHIRRIRGKIEDANHTFIETVRHIGYRFKKGN